MMFDFLNAATQFTENVTEITAPHLKLLDGEKLYLFYKRQLRSGFRENGRYMYDVSVILIAAKGLSAFGGFIQRRDLDIHSFNAWGQVWENNRYIGTGYLETIDGEYIDKLPVLAVECETTTKELAIEWVKQHLSNCGLHGK